MLRASRPYSWINTALPFLAVALITGRVTAAVVLGTLYFLLPYNLLLYGVNDLFDYESDRRNPRKGGAIEGGLVPPAQAGRLLLTIAATNLPLLLAMAWLAGPVAAGVLALTVLAAISYSAPPVRLKERPFLDSLSSSLHFVLPPVCGGLLAGTQVSSLPWRFLLAFLLWGMASQALGAIQDVEYDRAAGIGSIAAWLGGRTTAVAAFAVYLLAGVLTATGGGPALLAAVVVLPYAALALVATRRARTAWRGFLGLNLVAGCFLTLLLLQVNGVFQQRLGTPA
ncbi:MAG: prenyltransferase [Candidatus Dormibacteraeota bacterium]|nr:prenyltransferase [Candidatus Dormibacteraeota bacterium]